MEADSAVKIITKILMIGASLENPMKIRMGIIRKPPPTPIKAPMMAAPNPITKYKIISRNSKKINKKSKFFDLKILTYWMRTILPRKVHR